MNECVSVSVCIFETWKRLQSKHFIKIESFAFVDIYKTLRQIFFDLWTNLNGLMRIQNYGCARGKRITVAIESRLLIVKINGKV